MSFRKLVMWAEIITVHTRVQVADFCAVLGQATACLYLVMWRVGRNEQWPVENKVLGNLYRIELSNEHVRAQVRRRDIWIEHRSRRQR